MLTTFSSTIILLESTESTNQFAADLISKNKPDEGTAIVTQFQLAGKGQRGNKWMSEPGKNLLASLILYPDFMPIENLFLISQMVAVSIVKTLQKLTNTEFKVKWPNDIMWENHKVGGILIENSIKGNHCNISIVGIGLNLNQTLFPAFIPEAASVFTASGVQLNAITCINMIRLEMNKIYDEIKSERYTDLTNEFDALLYRKNETHEFISEGKSISGTILGVNAMGQLILKTDGEMLTFGIKEIKYCY